MDSEFAAEPPEGSETTKAPVTWVGALGAGDGDRTRIISLGTKRRASEWIGALACDLTTSAPEPLSRRRLDGVGKVLTVKTVSRCPTPDDG
jgi:hypothetical protein